MRRAIAVMIGTVLFSIVAPVAAQTGDRSVREEIQHRLNEGALATQSGDIGASETRFSGQSVASTQRHEEQWRRRDSRWEGYQIRELGGDLFVVGLKQEMPPPQPTPVRSADVRSESERQVMELERRWLDAYERSDVPAMNRILADGFVLTDGRGNLSDRAAILAQLSSTRVGTPTFRFCTVDVSPQSYSATVVLRGVVITEAVRGENVSRSADRYTDTYVQLGDSWRVAASQLTRIPTPEGAGCRR